MSDLISRSAFEKFIKEKYKDGESTDDIKDQMLFDLGYQPTAYDVDKVVAELEGARIPMFDFYTEEYEQVVRLGDAIEIVKNGCKTVKEEKKLPPEVEQQMLKTFLGRN